MTKRNIAMIMGNGTLQCVKESVPELKDNEVQFATEYRRARFEKK